VIAFFIVIGTNSASASVAVARIGAVFLSFLVFSDIASQALAWLNAEQKSNDVHLPASRGSRGGGGGAGRLWRLLRRDGDDAADPALPRQASTRHIEPAWRAAG
jgi:hypothetical protein